VDELAETKKAQLKPLGTRKGSGRLRALPAWRPTWCTEEERK
jgi:hypothetical protein